eukprot:6480418-Pyramimonas_sp.AAC.1
MSPVGADGNIRIGPAHQPHVAGRRAPADSLMSYLLYVARRPDGSGQCALRSSKQGPVSTADHAAHETS